MPLWGEDVDYELVMLEVHQFLVKFPSKWWTSRSVDTPLRTIKTIIHSTVKIKGAQSMQLLGKIPNPAESDIESYILRLLKVSYFFNSVNSAFVRTEVECDMFFVPSMVERAIVLD